MYGLQTKREGEINGYWSKIIFVSVDGPVTVAQSRSKIMQKKNNANNKYQAILTEQAWLIRDLLYMYGVTASFFKWNTASISE